MPRRLIACFAALVVFAACSGDDDDASPASTTRVTASSTTTVPPSLSDRAGVVAFPAARSVTVQGATLAPGEAIGFAFHPNGTVARVSASNADVELCPATTDGVIDESGGSWPGGVFATCHPIEQGVPSPGVAYHVGWALRSTATDDITVDVTIVYDATDGFFVWAPPRECGALVFEPASSDLLGVIGPGATVTQGGDVVAMHPDPAYPYDSTVGRVAVGPEVEVTCAADRAPNTSFIVDWV